MKSTYERNADLLMELVPEAQWAALMWLNDCFNLNYEFRISEVYRTTERQKALYARGRTKKGSIVTYMDGVKKKSNHQLRLAVDVYPINCGYADIESVANDYGIQHPFVRAPFVDLPHFEFINVKQKPKTRSPNAALRRLQREIAWAHSPRRERLIKRLNDNE